MSTRHAANQTHLSRRLANDYKDLEAIGLSLDVRTSALQLIRSSLVYEIRHNFIIKQTIVIVMAETRVPATSVCVYVKAF